MNLRTILHRPTRAAAVVAVAGLLFAACGTASGSEGADTRPAQPRQDTPVASAADADVLYHYLGTLTPDDRAQTIMALNPNIRGALEAIVAGNLAAAAMR
jgi:hypothetical protein